MGTHNRGYALASACHDPEQAGTLHLLSEKQVWEAVRACLGLWLWGLSM